MNTSAADRNHLATDAICAGILLGGFVAGLADTIYPTVKTIMGGGPASRGRALATAAGRGRPVKAAPEWWCSGLAALLHLHLRHGAALRSREPR